MLQRNKWVDLKFFFFFHFSFFKKKIFGPKEKKKKKWVQVINVNTSVQGGSGYFMGQLWN